MRNGKTIQISFVYFVLIVIFLSSTLREAECEKTTISGKIVRVPQEEIGKMRVKLQSNNFQTTAIPLTDGTFSLVTNEDGKYLLQVLSIGYNFSAISIDVKDGEVYPSIDHINREIEHPLVLYPYSMFQLVQKRVPYDFFGLLRTILIFGAIAGGILYLLKKVDLKKLQEEIKAEEELQKKEK